MPDRNTDVRDWDDLNKDEQLRLLEAYGYYLDSLPPTCDLQEKNRRFAAWLAQRNIRFSVD